MLPNSSRDLIFVEKYSIATIDFALVINTSTQQEKVFDSRELDTGVRWCYFNFREFDVSSMRIIYDCAPDYKCNLGHNVSGTFILKVVLLFLYQFHVSLLL